MRLSYRRHRPFPYAMRLENVREARLARSVYIPLSTLRINSDLDSYLSEATNTVGVLLALLASQGHDDPGGRGAMTATQSGGGGTQDFLREARAQAQVRERQTNTNTSSIASTREGKEVPLVDRVCRSEIWMRGSSRITVATMEKRLVPYINLSVRLCSSSRDETRNVASG